MTEKLFTSHERRQLEEIARRRGFESLRSYVQMLVKQDVEQHAETVAADDELDDPIESFKQGWADVREGRVMSHEEFVRRMSEDAD